MLEKTNVSLEEGQKNCIDLCEQYKLKDHKWNEANTRFHFIDELLTKCFGWPRDQIDLEHHLGGEFADYVLGSSHRALVVEAKKEGVHFDIPAGCLSKSIVSLQALISTSSECKSAVEQTLGYCSARGIEFGAISNGYQLIVFIGIKIGEPPLSGKALVVQSLDDLVKNFPMLWNHLCPDGVAERRLHRLLTTGTTASLPAKLSTRLLEFPKFRYPGELQEELRQFSELLIEDMPNTTDIEKQFYQEAYCDTGALSRDALLSKDILNARYAALFPTGEKSPSLYPVNTNEKASKKKRKKGAKSFAEEVAQEALSRRPIVLLGDGGVGKTSFIKNLMLVRASEQFDKSLFLYIDLGNKGTLSEDIRSFILDEIQEQLKENYGVDVDEAQLVKGVYDLEVKQFKSSIHAEVDLGDEKALETSVLRMLSEKARNKPEHLKSVVKHIANGRQKQVVIIIDNADQRSISVQQEAFVIAQDFSQNWNALTFISVRPVTFFQSKRSGAMSAYPHRVFTISPPRPELVVEKRLRFALKICKGELTHEYFPSMTLNIKSMSMFLQVLLTSIENNRDIQELLANITGGNIREVINFVKKFIGSPNVDAEKIVDIKESEGSYRIPLHEFSKAAILGDYSHFNPESSMATNLYDVEYPDEREHFLCPLVLGYLDSKSSPKDKDGFTTTDTIIAEMQGLKYTPRQVESALRRLTNKKLVETTQRITFEEDSSLANESLPFAFRLTSIGSYHHNRWLATFAYLDAMLFDTPLFDDVLFRDFLPALERFNIEDRLDRTLKFRDYLSAVWNKAGIDVPYFNWASIVDRDAHTYIGVQRAVKGIVADKGN